MGATTRQEHCYLTRTPVQKVAIASGIFLVSLGLLGTVMPAFFGMHLNFAHNLVHLVIGALGIWAGTSDSLRSKVYCLSFGTLFAFLGIAGFVIGQPGLPAVGNSTSEQSLIRIVPNILEFGTMDHGIHLLLSLVLYFGVYVWRKHKNDADAANVDVQGRRERIIERKHQ
jgi:hypothetical protein